MKAGYLFESRPDLFPEGYLTQVEISLWAKYYDQKKAEIKNG